MIILVTIGAFITIGACLALSGGLAIVDNLRNRKSGRGRVFGRLIDADKANALIPPDGRGSVYLPPPGDGRPQH